MVSNPYYVEIFFLNKWFDFDNFLAYSSTEKLRRSLLLAYKASGAVSTSQYANTSLLLVNDFLLLILASQAVTWEILPTSKLPQSGTFSSCSKVS